MPTELNTPNHRYYQPRYNIALPKEDMSRDFIFASGIAKIDAWIDLLAGRDYSVLGFEPLFVADFDGENYRVQGATTPSFSDAITHTRASTATYVDSTGTLQTAAINEPRVGHHVWNGSAWVNEGLLHESEARTNLLPYSEDFANAAWVKSNMPLGAGVTAPDGTTNSTKLIPNTVSAEHYIQDNLTAATGTFTDSVFAKADELKLFVIRPVHVGADQGATQQATFDLQAGVIVNNSANSTAAIQDFGNGWYRCSFTYTVSGTITGDFAVRLQIYSNTNANVFAGDNTSGLYVFGAQREIGPTPSSYIPTNSGSTVTRAADVLTIPAANLPWPSPVVIGPELVTNGTFDTDTSGWTAGSGAVLSVSNGQLVVSTLVGDNFGTTYQEIATVAGSVYEMKIDRISTNQEFSAGVSTTQLGAMDVLNLNSSGGVAGSFSGVFVGTGSNVFIRAGVGFNNTFEGTAVYDNISVREINPLALSIQMDGRVTFSDTGSDVARFVRWFADSSNSIINYLQTDGAKTGQVRFSQTSAGVFDTVATSDTYLSPDVLVPYNIASRHGSTFINGAADGVALTANTTPVALPNLSATDLSLGQLYNGTIRTFRIWGQDIGDTGLVEASS